MGKLTIKQKRFVHEYLSDFNATKAAERAGYSKASAGAIGHENLTKPEIRDFLGNVLTDLSNLNLIEGGIIIRALFREAFDTDGDTTPASRVNALDKLARIAGLYQGEIMKISLEKTIADISRENAANRVSLLPKDNINFEEIENDY